MHVNFLHIKRSLALLLVIVLLVPIGLFTPNPYNDRVHAITVTEVGEALFSGITTAIKATVSAAADVFTAAGIGSIVTKEYVLDTLTWFVNEVVIKHMTRSIVTWINSGFDGNPSFVTDLRGFLIDTADQVAGEFIEGTELGFLCDPFEFQIRLALSLSRNQFDVSCRLTDVVDNIDNFLAGDFVQGGWNGWFEVARGDNPYTRFLESQAELDLRIAQAQYDTTKKLEFGRGFLSFEECNVFIDEDGAESQDCNIVTPGSVIETQLNETLGSPRRRIEIGKEINEITSALLQQLVFQAFSTGLTGLSSSRNGRPSYISRLENSPDIPPGVVLNPGVGEILGLSQTLDLETNVRGFVSQTLGSVLTTEGLLIQLSVCNASSANSIRTQTVAPLRSSIEAQLVSLDANIAILTVLEIRLNAATNIDEAADIIDEFTDLARAGTFHNITTAAQEDISQQNKRRSLQNTDAQIQQLLSECGINGNQVDDDSTNNDDSGDEGDDD